MQAKGHPIAALVLSLAFVAGCDSSAMSDAPANQELQAPVSGSEAAASTPTPDEHSPELASTADSAGEANAEEAAAHASADTEAEALPQSDAVPDSALTMPPGLPVIEGLEIASIAVFGSAVTATGHYVGELEQLTTTAESAMAAAGWVPSPDETPETWLGSSRSWQRDDSRAALLIWPEQDRLGVQFSRTVSEGA